MKNILVILCLSSIIQLCLCGDDRRIVHSNGALTRSCSTVVPPFDDALLAQIKQCICALKSQVNTCCTALSSQLEIIEEDILSTRDEIITIDGTILSKIGKIDTQLDTLESLLELLPREECCSTIAAIESTVGGIVTQIEEIQTLLGIGSGTGQILQIISLLVSAVEQVGIVSFLDFLTQLDVVIENFTRVVESNIEINETILSKVAVIDTRTDAIYSLEQTIASQVHVIDTQLDSIESLVTVIGECNSCEVAISSRIDTLTGLAENKFSHILDIDQAILSKVDQLDTQLDSVESLIALLRQEGCCSVIATIDAQLNEITSLAESLDIDQIVNVIAHLISAVENFEEQALIDLLNNLPSQLDALDACAFIPITTAPYTISAPGTYCLANNVTGRITIEASDVVFDLNDHLITGNVHITGSASNVTVQNGSITNNNTVDNHGINIDASSSVLFLNNLYISSSAVSPTTDGVNMSSFAGTLTMDNVITYNENNGCYLSNEDANINFYITNSQFNNSVEGLWVLSNLSIGIIKNCQVTNTEFGLDLSNTGTVAGTLFLEDCIASNNQEGFLLGGTGSNSWILVKRCFAANNFTGFNTTLTDIGGTGTVLYEECIAMQNATGFDVEGNVRLIRCLKCLAVDNSDINFKIRDNSGSITMQNCSCEGDGASFDASQNASTILLQECIVINSSASYGFIMPRNTGSITAQNCSASNCAGGFDMSSNTGTIVIEECSATGNSGIGFDAGSSTGIQEVSSYATGNAGGDYNPSSGAPFFPVVATTAGVSEWYNAYS